MISRYLQQRRPRLVGLFHHALFLGSAESVSTLHGQYFNLCTGPKTGGNRTATAVSTHVGHLSHNVIEK